ncbi:MAG: hypothetical protein JSV88_22905 [Candidatus Aminicenantes bacterium]|nr:MAG: hypothetical protein JSV88_22905 [Candidatus Aminicenantes bacterium]
MDFDTVLGVIIIVGGIFFLTFVVLWSRRTIEMISKKRLHSIREILNELKNGR